MIGAPSPHPPTSPPRGTQREVEKRSEPLGEHAETQLFCLWSVSSAAALNSRAEHFQKQPRALGSILSLSFLIANEGHCNTPLLVALCVGSDEATGDCACGSLAPSSNPIGEACPPPSSLCLCFCLESTLLLSVYLCLAHLSRDKDFSLEQRP